MSESYDLYKIGDCDFREGFGLEKPLFMKKLRITAFWGRFRV